jgi:hypothetical protein
MSYTVTDLLNQVKRDAFVPVGQSTFEDSDILAVASVVIETDVLPTILASKGDFYLQSVETVIDSDGYCRIPARAVGNSIADVRDCNNNPIVDVETINQKLYFPYHAGQTVSIRYYLRPGKLTETYSTITSIDTATKTVVCTSVQSAFTTSLLYDFIRATGGYEALDADITCSSIVTGTNSMTFSELPTDLAVGDYVVIADTSPVPQIPVEAFGYLSHLTAIKMLQSLGDFEAAALLDKKTEGLKKAVLTLICPRVSKHSKPIVRPNKSRGYYGSY